MAFYHTLYTVVLWVLTVAIIVSNTFCIVVLRRVRSVINEAPQVLMTSLSLADLLNCTVCVLPLAMMFTLGIAAQPSLSGTCKFQALVLQVIQVVKVSSLLALNVDRYVAVTRALRYHSIVTTRLVYVVTAAIWAVALVFSLIYATAAGWSTPRNDNLMVCVFQLYLNHALHWLDLIFLVILPLVVTIAVYIRLSTLARRHAVQIGTVAHGDGNQDNNQQQRLALQNQARKSSKTTRLMTLVFAITCGPTVIAKMVASVDFLLNFFLIVWFGSGLCIIVVYFCRDSVILAASKAMLRQRLLPCHLSLLTMLVRARQFLSRICTRSKNRQASQLDPDVENVPTASPQTSNNN